MTDSAHCGDATCAQSGSQPLIQHQQALGQHADVWENLIVEVVHHEFEIVVALFVDGQAKRYDPLALGFQ